MERFGLRDDQWDRIKDILPGREGHVGGTAPDNRLFVEAILYQFRTHRHPCPLAVLPSGSKRCHSPSHRRGKASTSSLPRLTSLRCRGGKHRVAEPCVKSRG